MEVAGRQGGVPPSLQIDADGRANVWLNRPDHHNRLEPDDVDALVEIFATIADDRGVRVVTLSARGRSFCAGYDLSDLGTPLPPTGQLSNQDLTLEHGRDTDARGEMPDEKGAAREGGIALLAELADTIEACAVPTICALNGPVFGGGTDLALACDFRIGTTSCRMMMPAGRFGLHYYHGGLRRYVERLGLGPAKRLFLLGETLDAEAMRQIGYLDVIVADETALAACVEEMTETILSAADPAVIDSMKRCLNLIAAGTPDMAAADRQWLLTRRSPAVGEAVARARSKKPTR